MTISIEQYRIAIGSFHGGVGLRMELNGVSYIFKPKYIGNNYCNNLNLDISLITNIFFIFWLKKYS